MIEASLKASGLPDTSRWWKFLSVWVMASLGLLTSNPLLTMAGFSVLPLLAMLLWRRGEPPVLLLVALSQWLQVFTPVLQADLSGERVGTATRLPEMEMAAWLGLLAVLSLALGMRAGAGQGTVALADEASARWERQVSRSRLFIAYVVALAFAAIAPELGWMLPSLRQVVLVLAGMRWAVVFIVLLLAATRSDLRVFAAAVVVIETIIGLGGYFSGFKVVYFLGAIALFTLRPRSNRLAWPGLAIMGVFMIGFSVVWQAVKDDYRPFLSQGETAQVVLVSPMERYAFLLQRTLSLGSAELLRGMESGADRLGYLEYFARAIETVPAQIPFQEGRLWWEAAMHVVTPRAFFPDKPEVNDSDRTNTYCGVRVHSADQGTSVSIGYAGESYIDFGPVMMFLPIFLLGMFWGWGYRWLSSWSKDVPLGVAAGVVFVMSGALLFESSNIKIVGGGVTALIVWTLLLRLGGRKIARFLTAGSQLD